MVIPREPERINHLKGLRRDYTPAPRITKPYLLGLLHDATERRNTFRIGTSSFRFSCIVRDGIEDLGFRAWTYREGRSRHLWVIEFSKNPLKDVEILRIQDKIDYIRGYFDAEGGIAKSPTVRFYIYFAQKNRKDLEVLKGYLEEIGLSCGKVHNPSRREDPNYWRFFIRSKSYSDFVRCIVPLHLDKKHYSRMKI